MLEIEITYPKTDSNPNGDPLPTQMRFHRSDKKERVLAGGWGSGKTRALLLEMSKDIVIPNNYILIGRLDMNELISSTLRDFLEIYNPIIVNHNKQERTIKFPNGTIVYYTNLDEARDAVKKIQSLNLGAVVLDQLEELSENVYIALVGRLRRQGTRRCIYSAMNPNGHDWIYHKFIADNNDPNREIFITTTLENIYLPKDYVESLLKMPEQWVKRYVYCSFDEWEGMVYEKYNETIHKMPKYRPSLYENHYIVLDYGFRNPTAILWISVDFDGVARVWDEFYQASQLISELSEVVKTRHSEIFKKATLLIDPSAFHTRQDGKTIADEFMNHGVYFMGADNVLMQGIDRVNTLFVENKLLICENCVNTIKEISNYRWKSFSNKSIKRNYPEEPNKKDDHAMDCLRYFANFVNAPKKKEVTIVPKWMSKLRKKYQEVSFMGI